MRTIRYSVILALAVASAGAGSQTAAKRPAVEVEYDPGRDFSQYRTYAWSKSQEPAPNGADHIRIMKAVSREMKELGFQLDKKHPDVLVLYRMEVKSKVESRSSQRDSVWEPTDVETRLRLERYEEGSLALMMFDAETNALIWRAKCVHIQGPPDKAEENINETVQRILGKYPTENS